MKVPSLLACSALLFLGMPTLTHAHSGQHEERVLEGHPPASGKHHRRHRPARVVHDRGRSGAYIGLGVVGNYFVETDDELSKVYSGGGGLSLMIGARLSPFLGIELSYMGSFQSTNSAQFTSTPDNAMIQSVGGDMKMYLVPQSARLQPYLQLGAAVYMFSEEFREELTGGGLRAGGGVDFGITPSATLGFRLLYHGFYVDNSDAEYGILATESAFLNTLTIEGNVQFHF
jgi:hypothetical protein